jgi:ribosomal protein S30
MAVKTEAQRRRVQRIQDMRRSNATEPVRNRKRYSRKVKHAASRYTD